MFIKYSTTIIANGEKVAVYDDFTKTVAIRSIIERIKESVTLTGLFDLIVSSDFMKVYSNNNGDMISVTIQEVR